MTHQVRAFARGALWMLPVWAIMLFLGTLTHQPDPQTDFANFALYVTTNQFLISHILNSILGVAIGSIGVNGLMLYLQDNRSAGKAITGMVATVVANTLNTAVFGAAAFTQPALGQAFLAGQQNALYHAGNSNFEDSSKRIYDGYTPHFLTILQIFRIQDLTSALNSC